METIVDMGERFDDSAGLEGKPYFELVQAFDFELVQVFRSYMEAMPTIHPKNSYLSASLIRVLIRRGMKLGLATALRSDRRRYTEDESRSIAMSAAQTSRVPREELQLISRAGIKDPSSATYDRLLLLAQEPNMDDEAMFFAREALDKPQFEFLPSGAKGALASILSGRLQSSVYHSMSRL